MALPCESNNYIKQMGGRRRRRPDQWEDTSKLDLKKIKKDIFLNDVQLGEGTGAIGRSLSLEVETRPHQVALCRSQGDNSVEVY